MSRLPHYFKVEGAPRADEKKTVVGQCYRFTVITSRLIRCEWNDDGKFEDSFTRSVVDRNFGDCSFQVEESDEKLIIKTEHLILEYAKTGRFNPDNLSITVKGGKCWYFGTPLKTLKGTARTLDCADGEIELGDGVCSREGFSVIDDKNSVLLDSDGFIMQRESYDIEDLYFFGYKNAYLDAVKDYFRLTGKPSLLPAFAMGNWWSRYYKYTEKSYTDLMKKFTEEDIPFSVSVIDMDWHIVDVDPKYGTGWTGYTWNKKFFPDYKRFLKWLTDHNLTPSLNLHPADGVRAFEEMYPDMAKAVGIDPESEDPVKFDMSNPDFIKAYFDVLHHPYEKDGVRFWWMDWQQGTRSTIPNIDPLWVLNHYHTLDAKREGKREIIFSRFAGPGSQRFPIGFSGDTVISWKSLDFQPYFTLTASNIGYTWWSHDIGGHMMGYRDDELNARWVQLGVFSPINRLHSSSSPFSSREPWCYDKNCESSSRRFLKLRHRMFPYLYAMNYRQHLELEPIIQPLYYHWQNASTYGLLNDTTRNSYLFGSELFVAPITTPADKETGLGKVRIWMPNGVWVDAFRGSVYRGNKIYNVYRKFDEMPVFAKAGAIVPMNIPSKGDNKLQKWENMEIFVFPGNSNSFTLYEDDGDSELYREGKLATTTLTLDYTDKKAVFKIGHAEGDLNETVTARRYVLRFRGYNKSLRAKVEIDGVKKAVRREYDESTNTVTLFIPKTAVTSEVKVELTAKNLLHDNSDRMDRIFDIILHAQISYQEKADYWDAVKRFPNSDKDIINYLVTYNGSKEVVEAILEQLMI